MIDKNEFWSGVTDYLRDILSDSSYANWVKPVTPTRITESTISIAVPNSLIKMQWERSLAGYILQYSLDYYGREISPIFIINSEPILPPNPDPQPIDPKLVASNSNLNPNYTFDTFVVGSDNKMANGAALAVCDAPGRTYNPFLIYGGVGLGKTHLMHAIGNEILRKNPQARIKYATTETFTNDFINSITHNKTEQFKKMYRDDIDVLLMDDIQFLSNKDKTQEEFFHTFNDLFNAGKQIVLTCDRLPNQIDNLEERLISRFKWGLSTDITPPNLETRIAILRKKALNDHLDINSETLTYIANNVDSNIRELEGALIRVIAYSAISGEEITVSLASRALNSLIGQQNEALITVSEIIETVAHYFNVTVEDIKGSKRVKSIVYPRQIAMYLSRELTEVSYPKIGEDFGNKNHTTVMHAYEKIDDQLKQDSQTKHDIDHLREKLRK